MPMRTTLIALSILSSITLAATAVAGITPEQKCASAKMKATSKMFAAKAKCHAKALSKSEAVVADCLLLAASKFNSAFTKAESGACLHDGDAASIEAKLDTVLNDVVGDIGCGNGQLEGDKGCDDGNTVSGDGCDGSCVEEPGFDCVGQPSVCTPACEADGGTCDGNNDCCSENCVVDTCQAPLCQANGGACDGNNDCCSENCVVDTCAP